MELDICDKIFTITLINTSNNDVVVHILERFWQIKNNHSKLFHLRCCAYILNLIVKDGLKQVDSTL